LTNPGGFINLLSHRVAAGGGEHRRVPSKGQQLTLPIPTTLQFGAHLMMSGHFALELPASI
jgi:hypothetical protein